MYEIIGCPMHWGVSEDGLKRSIDVLNERYADLNIKKIDEIEMPEENLSNLKNLNSVVATCTKLAEVTDEIISTGKTPICIGGDHSLAMGTVSGSAKSNKKMGLLWVDSHSDINTDVSTISGNIHGMPVSALMGFGNEKLVSIYGADPKVLPQHVVLFGVRDMDPLEVEIVEKLDIRCYTYHEIVTRGLKVCLDEVKEYLNDINKLHISFDLDSMDPDIIKGVTVPVKSGFVEEDVNQTIDYCLDNFEIASIDIVEFNPKFDEDLYTAEYTNSLIKRIINK